MQLALQRLLANQSTLHVSCNVIQSSRLSIWLNQYRHYSLRDSVQDQSTRAWTTRSDISSDANKSEDKVVVPKDAAVIRESQATKLPGQRLVDRSIEQHRSGASKNGIVASISKAEVQGKREHWRKRLCTFEQYQYQSDLTRSYSDVPLLVDHKLYAGDWRLWLELIRFRKRHFGGQGIQVLFKELFRRGLSLPTVGALGKELWDLLVAAGHQDSKFLLDIVLYAVNIKQNTGRAPPDFYYSILVQALKTDPTLAYNIHIQLKEHFPPNINDYRRLFRSCARRNNVNDFEGLYRNLPLQGIYATIIPELCILHRYRDAVKWHNLLLTFQDFPSVFADIHPLLTHLVQMGDDRQLELIIKDLKVAYGKALSIPNAAEKFVRKHDAIGREIFNRHLGDIHGVAPKRLSDGFCARLFATKLFSVDMVISGLQIMGVDTIGPLAMREIASRDDCDTKAICRHLTCLKDVGVIPDTSAFATLVQNLACRGERDLLKSLVECDLHPDNFEDHDLQERLLTQYYALGDRLQYERTLAAITVRCREQDLLKWRLNLTLRSLITLRKQEAVISVLELMRQENVPVTARSSRHLRVRWLTTRQRGRGARSTQDLSIIVNATISTLQSGGYVPIIAWKEIMRRLGMAGRLDEFESLALWLVDFYISSPTQRLFPIQTMLRRESRRGFAKDTNPQAFLKTLFTTDAQHAIVAWGFQAGVKGTPKILRIRARSIGHMEQRPIWMWGLMLLHRLQARGVPIHRSTVARICIHRLKILFGKGASKRRINRRSRWLLKDERDQALDRRAFRFYIGEITKIWGKGLVRPELELALIRGPTSKKAII